MNNNIYSVYIIVRYNKQTKLSVIIEVFDEYGKAERFQSQAALEDWLDMYHYVIENHEVR